MVIHSAWRDEVGRRLDELFEAATLIQCKKIGPFPLVLMGAEFWEGMQRWGRHHETRCFRKERAWIWPTDSPQEAVELIVRSMPLSLRKLLKPQKQH
jgi:predicted Rossmann-fold nucleotide-binding protein